MVSAALCRGLIEAGGRQLGKGVAARVSAALCRGLIEARRRRACWTGLTAGFRGFMPRPH